MIIVEPARLSNDLFLVGRLRNCRSRSYNMGSSGRIDRVPWKPKLRAADKRPLFLPVTSSLLCYHGT